MSTVGALNDEALKRKERLKALRDKRAAPKTIPDVDKETDEIKEKERLPK